MLGTLLRSLWLSLWILFPEPSIAIPLFEFNSLKDLYDSTSGSSWEWKAITTGAIWNFTVNEDGIPYYDPCGSITLQVWQGINCSSPPDECNATTDCNIFSLSLVGYNLQGSLPHSLSNLSLLERLTLSESSITGNIPSSLSEIITLSSLNLHQNSLVGLIPSTFGSQLQSLLRLDLGSNSLSGSIPSSLSSIQSLEHLILSGNHLNGSLPSFSNWSNLISFSLAENSLTGTLPPSISSLSNLVYLDFDQNQLRGPIPSAISRLSRLRILDLDKNQFTGKLPTEIALLPVLNFLYTSSNQLTGEIPTEYGNIHGLLWFMSYLNHHNGTIPSSLGQCRLLLEVMFHSNSLTGHLPSSLSNCPGLLRVDFSSNSLIGSLPNEWSQLRLLNQIFLHNNQLTGTIPDSYGDISSLNAIDLSQNKFSGTLPSTLFQLREPLVPVSTPPTLFASCEDPQSPDWRRVFFSERHIWNLKGYDTSDIVKILQEEVYPSQCRKKNQQQQRVTAVPSPDLRNGTVNFLRDILLANNRFTGCLPSNLCNPRFLRMFFIADNQFHCNLPPLSNCSSLELLWVQNNFITGKPGVSVGDGNLTHLEALDLSNNRFSGTIPYEFFSLPMIDSIVITSGCYQGPLSSRICDGSNLTTLTLEGLHAGSECQIPITNPFAVKEVYFTDPFGGEIPSCLWQMSNLEALHLTGNGHHGSLPTRNEINFPKMKNLNLKLNSLSGDSAPLLCLLPDSYLDLSNNKLAHTLHRSDSCQEISSSTPNGELHIENNRISGPLPSYLSHLSSLSVLAGAATQYSCSFFSRNQLPERDPEHSSYICGSQLLDSALVLWTLLAVTSVYYFRTSTADLPFKPSGVSVTGQEQRESASIRDWSLWKDPSPDDSNLAFLPSSAICFLRATKGICGTVNWILVGVLTLYGPLIVIVKIFMQKKTEEYQFTWITTLSGMTGFTAAMLCLFCGTFVISFLSILLPVFLGASGVLHGEGTKTEATRPSRTICWSYNWIINLLILLIDIAIVSGIKIGYVYYLLNNTSGLLVTMTIQICFSLLDHLWNVLVSYLLISSDLFHFHFVNQHDDSAQYSLYLLLLLVNSILGPALATMVTDEKCFSNAFVGIDSVHTEVEYQYCDFKLSDLDCSRHDSISMNVEFIPPFLYSHECYAAVIKHFLPIIILNQCASGFLRPLLWHLVSRRNFSQDQILILKSFGFPLALWTGVDSRDSQDLLLQCPPYNPRKALTEMMHHLAILLTYGLVSPVVAILVTCTLTISYRLWTAILHRYYAHTSPTAPAESPAVVSELEILRLPCQQLLIVIALAYLFLLCLSADIAGDESEESMVNLLLMGGVPCLLWICLFPPLCHQCVGNRFLDSVALLEEYRVDNL
jgi:Leucine-rich repeat (LRR) protein